jgi:Uma2 family endonuclease
MMLLNAGGAAMTIAEPKLMTADEFFCMPDEGKVYELVEGRLVEVGGASWRSSTIAMTIGALLTMFVRQHRLGKVSGADLGTKLASKPDTVRVPDVAFVRAERFRDGKGPRRFFVGAPDLCIEVLSPTDRYSTVRRKIREYLAAGAEQVWVIDPETRAAVVHRAGGAEDEYAEDGVIDGGDLLPGFTLRLAEIWEDVEDEE